MQYTTSSENYSSSLRDSPSRWSGKDDKGYVYKKSSYQYSSPGGNNISYHVDKSSDKNIDQLDALLEDLKNERQITRDRDPLSTSANYRTIERERGDPSGTITKTTRVVKTSKHSGGQPHQILDDVENFSTSDYSTLKSNGYTSLQGTLRGDDYHLKSKPYGSSNLYESKSKIYESNRILDNVEVVPSTIQTTSTSNLEKDLQNITLTDDILPIPGTKVTTTVRTYTYEVPAGSPSSASIISSSNRNQQLNNTIHYNSMQRNDVHNTTIQPHAHPVPTIPPTVVYNTESYSTINKNHERPIVSNQLYEMREHRETNTIHNNNGPPQQRNPPQPSIGPGGTTKTIVYNVNTTENVHNVPEYNNYPRGPGVPAHSPHSPIDGTYGSPPHGSGVPPTGPTTSRYFYKESSNVVNTVHGTGGPGGPGAPSQPNVHQVYNPPTQQSPNKLSPTGYPPHGGDGYPPPSTVTYKYSSSTTNSRRGGPDYGTPSPTTHLAPFPVDGVDYPANGNPPQRVDDLMQSFRNADTVDKSEMITRKREVETSVASPNQQNVPSVNKAGKEVYYPPGHEMMMTKREEMHAGSAAGGRWAKGSGMYEYESGSRSKTTTKSGGAMVPVCLPLCCAMPCSIM